MSPRCHKRYPSNPKQNPTQKLNIFDTPFVSVIISGGCPSLFSVTQRIRKTVFITLWQSSHFKNLMLFQYCLEIFTDGCFLFAGSWFNPRYLTADMLCTSVRIFKSYFRFAAFTPQYNSMRSV